MDLFQKNNEIKAFILSMSDLPRIFPCVVIPISSFMSILPDSWRINHMSLTELGALCEFIPLALQTTLWNRSYYYSYFTDEEIEAHACLAQVHGASKNSSPNLSDARAVFFIHRLSCLFLIDLTPGQWSGNSWHLLQSRKVPPLANFFFGGIIDYQSWERC